MLKPILIAAAIFAAAATQAAPPPRPRLIVAISVDQYSSEIFRRYRATYTAGLRTLANGIAYPTGYHAPTLAGVAEIIPPAPVDGRCLDLGGNCRK